MTRNALLLLVLASACGGRAADRATTPPPPAEGSPELAVLDRFRALDDQVEKTRGSCPDLARGITSWLDGNAGEISALLRSSRERPALADVQVADLEQRLERIFDRVLDAVTTCRGQGGVDRAYARLDAWLEAS